MKQLLSILPAALMLAGFLRGQDSTVPSTDRTSESPAAGPRGYTSEGYGSRAEVFVTGFGLFTSHAAGNSIAHQATESGGFSAGYRFHLNAWSAFEGRYGFSRNSQKYYISGTVSSIPAYLAEITGSYVYSLPRVRRIQPFLEGGGGIVHFSPGAYGNASNSSNGDPTGGGGGGYLGPYSIVQRAAPVYTGSSPGVDSQTRPTFVYGMGIDFPAFSRFSFRVEYRGLAYKTPDFHQVGLQTNAFGFLSEPSFGVAYRF